MKSALLRHPLLPYALVLLYVAGLGLVWPGLWAPQHGDEGHFIRTLHYLAQHPTIEGLRTYPEMSTPLPFALYAAWGDLLGWADATLRLLSLLLAAATLWQLHLQLHRLSGSAAWALVALAWLLLNPYMAGLSLYVYTDMLALLCLLLSVQGWLAGRVWLYVAGAALALLCRQYLVFWPLAVGLQAAWLYVGRRQLQWLPWAVGSLLCVLPLAGLLLLWQGTAPASPVREFYLRYGLGFQPAALLLYISLLPLVLAPWALPRLWQQRHWLPWAACLGLAQLYWLWPIGPAPISADAGVATVGLLQRGLHYLPYWVQHAAWIGLLTLGFYWLGLYTKTALKGTVLARLLLLATGLFLLLMPFSYLIWEKYILPLLLLQLLAIAHSHGTHRPNSQS